jgi:hypothetical protein
LKMASTRLNSVLLGSESQRDFAIKINSRPNEDGTKIVARRVDTKPDEAIP